MKETQLQRAMRRLNRFNHVQLNYKVDSIMQHLKNNKISFSHIDSDYEEYHNRIEVMLIQKINKYQAKLLAEAIENTYQLETYYSEIDQHLEITLYQHLS